MAPFFRKDPYQRLMDLSEGGFSFELDPDTSDAEEQLDTFLQQARNLFEETRFPLGADTAPALSLTAESLQQLQDLFGSSVLPLGADALSGLPDLLTSATAAAAPVVNQMANNSVQAPASINVTAAGTDPERWGSRSMMSRSSTCSGRSGKQCERVRCRGPQLFPRFLITGDLIKPKDSCQVQNILIARLVKTAVPSPP